MYLQGMATSVSLTFKLRYAACSICERCHYWQGVVLGERCLLGCKQYSIHLRYFGHVGLQYKKYYITSGKTGVPQPET